MENTNNDVFEFEVLGFKVRFRPDDDDSQVEANEVVEYIRKEAKKLKITSHDLESGEAAILLALRVAHDKLVLENEYRESIAKLHTETTEAIKIIDNITLQDPS
ncbi:MAG: cell division protein ZapA [Bacteriovoracaceae bacterium]|nr:cell division protein ZapA [Bacteriovoracaceae bacterium]